MKYTNHTNIGLILNGQLNNDQGMMDKKGRPFGSQKLPSYKTVELARRLDRAGETKYLQFYVWSSALKVEWTNACWQPQAKWVNQ